MKIELAEHREVEKELAKRSHFCNRVIKKYKEQIQILKDEIKARQPNTTAMSAGDNTSKSGAKGKETITTFKNDLTQFLQKRITDYE